MKARNKLLETEVLEAEATSPEAEIVEKGTRRLRLFSSLQYPNYRYLWSGALLSNVGTWIQTVALGWFVFQITRSEFLLGLVNFTSSLPTFFLALVGGAVADRYEKRALLIISQAILMLLAFLLGILISLNLASVIIIILISLVAGIASSFNFPAWQALIPELVPRKDLMNAVALNSAQFNAARLIGPAIAGIIIAQLGVSYPFYINAISFLAVIIALALVKPHPTVKHEISANVWQNIVDGINYVRSKASTATLLIAVGMLTVFGMSHTVLIPVYADVILNVGPSGLGYLVAASGLGAVFGALLVASLSHTVDRRSLIKTGILSYSIFLFIFALSKIFIVSLIAQAGIGISFLVAISSSNTSLQDATPSKIRGRVMSLFVWAFIGIYPIGSFLVGSVAQLIGSPAALVINSIILLITSAVLYIRKDLLEA
ncbi:MAG: MFS transporter [Actinomycetota bacterium]|nr:MFS transporter [Actinomycetota bacterium]